MTAPTAYAWVLIEYDSGDRHVVPIDYALGLLVKHAGAEPESTRVDLQLGHVLYFDECNVRGVEVFGQPEMSRRERRARGVR